MTPYIALMIIGVIICLLVLSIKNKYHRLTSIGEKVEGTLMNYEYSKVKTNLKIPVAHFMTKDGQWITKETEDSIYSSNSKKGTKFIVFYNPENPEDFLIQGKNFKLMYSIVLAGGILFSLSGLILLLNYTGILKLFK